MTNEQLEFYKQLINGKDYNKGQEQLIKDTIKLGLSEQEVENFITSWDSKEIIIPKGVETIGDDAFYKCENLEKVTLPSTLKEIDGYAFDYCTSLKEVSSLNKDLMMNLHVVFNVSCNMSHMFSSHFQSHVFPNNPGNMFSTTSY